MAVESITDAERADTSATSRVDARDRVPDATVLLAPLLAIVSLLAMSMPGGVPIAATMCLVGWFALSVVWVINLERKIRHHRAGRSDHRPFWVFLVLPSFFFIVLFSAVADLPIRARFSASHDDLTSAANVVLEAGSVGYDGRIGSIPIQSIETNGVSVSFVTSGFGTTNRWGYIYAPAGAPARAFAGEVALTDLGGDWYMFHEGKGPRIAF